MTDAAPSLAAVIPRSATFRRAEGLTFDLHPCDGMKEATVSSLRHDGLSSARLSMDLVRILGRLGRWQTADEVGADQGTLVRLTEQDFLFWSAQRPRRDLTGAPLPELAGRMALRRQVWPSLHMLQDGELAPLPFMPRRGELEGGSLVGFEFAPLEMDLDTCTVSFACCPRHGTLIRDMLPRLDGRHGVEEFEGEERPILEALDALGLLERNAPRDPVRSGRITWLGHAAVLYEGGGQRILVDPVVFPCSIPCREVGTPADWRDVGPVDAVLITHGDHDHLNDRALSFLSRETPIFVPRASVEEPYQVDMEGLLAFLGFHRVTALDEWETLRLGDVSVVAVPFRGEDWGLNLATRTYLIDGPELTVYLSSDSAFMPDVYQRLAREFRIDLAFLGVSGDAEVHVMPPYYGCGGFYHPWIPAERRNCWIELCSGSEEAAQAARLLGAKRAFGYAMGPFMAPSYSARGSHREMAGQLAVAGAPELAVDLPLGRPVNISNRLLAIEDEGP